MTELVLFDIGAVQLRLNYSTFFERAQDIATDGAKFRRQYPLLEAEYFKHNEPTAAREFLTQIKRLLGREDYSDGKIKEILASAWGNPIEDILDLKSRVHSAYTVGNFSNITKVQLEMLTTIYPKIVEGYVGFPSLYSCQLGITKADQDIYKVVKEFDPIIFIDDNITYVQNAVAAGWKGIWLTAYIDQFEAQRGVTTEGPAPTQLKVANSVQRLEETLGEFGIKI